MSLKPKVVNFEEKWKEVSRVVHILMNNSENLSRNDWLDSFSLVYTLCTAAGSETMFERTYFQTKTLMETHVDQIKEEILEVVRFHFKLVLDYQQKFIFKFIWRILFRV